MTHTHIYKHTLLTAVLLLASAAYAGDKGTLTITPASADADALNGGIVFALPQTVVRIKLTATAIIETVGPFYKYSARYLNINNPVQANGVRWHLTAAEVTTVGRSDELKRYKISALTSAEMPSVVLRPDGRLAGINIRRAAPEPEALDSKPDLSPANLEDAQLTQDVLSRTSSAAMAEGAAQAIYELRAQRRALIAGDKEAQMPDAGAMRLALDELNRQEAQHVELFAGRRDTLTVVKYVDIVPDYNGVGNLVPVRFSETHGFLDAMDLTGKPVYVDMEFDDKQKVAALPATSKERKAPLTGLKYIRPGNLTVKVLDRNIPLCTAHVLCTQNGQLADLPIDYLQTHRIVIDPASGAISELRPLDNKTLNDKK